MNKGQKKYLLTICILLMPVYFINNTYADELGRLFLTKAERKKIDELRYAKLRETEPIKIVIEDIIEKEPVEEAPVIGDITVKGLVYRKGGKSTAWINDSNTFEGDLSNQYIQIDADDIDPGNVRLKTPENETGITLKVGETYNANADKVTDLTENYTKQ